MIVNILFLLFGLILGLALVFNPYRMIIGLTIMSLLVAGSFMYFLPSLSGVSWTVTVMGFFFFLKAMTLASFKETKVPGFLLVMFLFLLLAVFSTGSNLNFIGEVLGSAKNYFQFWSVPVALLFVRLDDWQLKSLLRLLLVIAVLQVPVALVQHFFFIDYGHRLCPEDSIVGTFGGSSEGGGNSGAQTTFITSILFLLISRVLYNRLGIIKCIMISSVLVIPIIMNETKIFFIYAAIGMAIIFAIEWWRRPAKTFLMLIIISMLAGVILTYYLATTHDHSSHNATLGNVRSYYDQVYSAQLDNKIGTTDPLNRIQAIVYWFLENSIHKNPGEFLFGHGLGASRDSGLVHGHLSRLPRYATKGLSSTTFCSLLWDVGLLGAIAYVGIFFCGFLSAFKTYISSKDNETTRCLMLWAMVTCTFFVGCCFYHNYLHISQALNFYAMLVLGVIAQCMNQSKRDWAV